MSKALMIQGTGSGVGKSIIVSGLCRIFRDLGINVAPFKAQNMALNSFITKEGGEIGRAQAFQAEAARVEPSIDMNPILLKASGEAGCQVILHGRVYANMKAHEYYAFKTVAWKAVTDAYERLSNKYDLIVIEGAGSPAEINLSADEVVNMSVARHTKAPVILVGDIDKGGVFASIYGTIGLLGEDAGHIKAFIINKFRGDINILNPGLRMIEEITNRPVIGVLPYLGDLGLHEEDGIPMERYNRFRHFEQVTPLKIVVLRLRYIANFTDFDPFMYEPDVDINYSLLKRDIENADLVIIPGSKNTVKDLLFLREEGIEESLKRAVAKGVQLIGVCGGYQMLGKQILDPFGIESEHKTVKGLGLLNIETTLEKTKVMAQVEAQLSGRGDFSSASLRALSPNPPLRGYEIHMGRTTGDIGLFKIKRPSASSCSSLVTHDSSVILDGSAKGGVWGTYIHGLFDDDGFRRELLNSLRKTKGLALYEGAVHYEELKETAVNNWANTLRDNLDMDYLLKLAGKN
jgi:adenosylcobyric acid synthase